MLFSHDVVVDLGRSLSRRYGAFSCMRSGFFGRGDGKWSGGSAGRFFWSGNSELGCETALISHV